jgi:membrane associated rhomboid family serine protease
MQASGSSYSVFRSFWLMAIIVATVAGVFLFEIVSGIHLTRYGLYPRNIEGLRGILYMPFIHADWSHLLSNLSALAVLLWLGFYTFGRLYFVVFFFIWFASGTWAWFFARDSYHIGASGLVYGLAVFSLVTGMLSKNNTLKGLALITLFLYGSFLWGLFPWEYTRDISWEVHLTGAMAGGLLAWLYRPNMPPPPGYSWQNEPDDPADGENAYWKTVDEEHEKQD